MTKIRKCTLDDLQTLQHLSRETFYDTFKEQNSAENMQAYLEKAFNTAQLKKELMADASRFYFVTVDHEIAGYLKINTADAQTEPMGTVRLKLNAFIFGNPFKNKVSANTYCSKPWRWRKNRIKRKSGSVFGKRTKMHSPFIKKWVSYKQERTLFIWVMKNRRT